jgi:hypothetical protein
MARRIIKQAFDDILVLNLTHDGASRQSALVILDVSHKVGGRIEFTVSWADGAAEVLERWVLFLNMPVSNFPRLEWRSAVPTDDMIRITFLCIDLNVVIMKVFPCGKIQVAEPAILVFLGIANLMPFHFIDRFEGLSTSLHCAADISRHSECGGLMIWV